MGEQTEQFRAARDGLLRLRTDYEAAIDEFEWPRFEEFNFALDWFDEIARDNDAPALWIVEEDGREGRWSYRELSERSNRVANHLRAAGVRRGTHVMVMLGNQVELWETMLAGIKLGAVLMPTTTQLGPIDLRDRVERGEAEFVVAGAADAAKFDEVAAPVTRIVVGARPERAGDIAYADADGAAADFEPDGPTRADDLLLLYFTSGTTSKAKMVAHTHVSYPVGHLSTLYWTGMEPGDVHLNVASPGWAKHAWSNIFTPWIAQACVFLYNYTRFDASALMATMERAGVTSFCAPPTVWRMLIHADLGELAHPPAKALSAGEPLNPEVISRVRREWDVTIRDGFGQTESTLQIGNPPGQPLHEGSMGRPLPGYDVVLRDPATGEEGDEGEICLRLDPPPVGLTAGYWNNPDKTAEAFADGVYHTGDVAARDADGYITYVGRADDVFKASDYRLSPFELESVLIEHEAVIEAAVVPSPDPVRLAVPKAYVVLAPAWEPTAETAEDILRFCREQLAPYKRIRRIEFAELPKTISGKIRRVELRTREQELHGDGGEAPSGGREWSDADFPGLKDG
ncbi:AMP-binding protein [Brevibacterium sp. 5221]|uniref:AMP-binding protein n=1 Tax=Brevibacterium rongguiense TaxID=2695267 RepID=A0A6N9HBC8_9MICO|nr:AMP-binding protein [Brevibacterium rongguiense]MYM20872.1 AMP-binding protein [Brevibacterium rongguiense]